MIDPLARSAAGRSAAKASPARRLLPVAVLAAGFAAFFAFGLDRYVSFDTLRENRVVLRGVVAENGALAIFAFAAVYVLVVAFSVPGAAVMTITGGFLFGIWAGGAAAVIGATAGATAVFLIARSAVGDGLRARAGPFVGRMEAGFRENALSYLLFLRLMPLFPFWLVNLVAAFVGVPTGVFVLATLVGIVPGTLVFASVGNGVGAIFDAGGAPDPGIIFAPEILGPLVALAILALLPVVYKKLKGRSGGTRPPDTA